MGIPEFDVRGLYRAVEISGENRESAITHFRQVFLKMYGPEVTDTVSDRTSPVYFGVKPDLAMRGHPRTGIQKNVRSPSVCRSRRNQKVSP